jgi:outer membrane receptor protein involved in Fe transport
VSSLEPLERTTASVSGTFQTAQISELPINGRDYGRFSLLTPGTVITTNHIADITFNGTPDTANQFTIDGIDATSVDGAYMANGSERGARLLTGSLDTIAEFKTLSSTYTADYGRASGGVVNIVTKSGDNTLHGGVYNFLRNDYLDAKNYFQTPGTSAPKRFNDFGGNLSGPVIRKRMFFFANYEGTRQSIGLVGAGTVLSPAKRASLEATVPALDPIIEAMPSPTSTSAYIHSVVLSPTSDPNVDTINFGATNHVAENVGSLRLDNTWSDKDSSFVRFNTNYALVNGPMMTVTPTAFGLADHQLVTTDITNVAVSETHIFSPTFLNNFIGGLQQYVTSFDEAQSLPTVTIGGLTFAPGNRGLYGREPKDVQLGDSVTLVKGRHTLKAGVNMWNVYYPFHGYISAPSVSFASLTAFYANKVQSASISATFPNNTTKMIEVGSFITDSWQLRPNVALNLGLRWDWNQVPHDLTSASVWSLATNSLTSPGSPYYNSYYKNFAPRVGVAWSPTSGVVLRVGYGIYIEAFQIGNYYNKISNTTPGSTTLSSANIPTLSFPVTPFLNSATTALPSLTGYEATPRNPLNNQWSLSLGMQASSKTTISLAYVGNRAVHLLVSEGVNYVSPVTGVRPYPSYTSITASTWGTSSNYNGFQAELKESITEGLTGTAEFTYSHALGTRRLHSNPSTLQTTTDHPGTTSVKTCHSTCCISCHSVEVRDFCLVRRMQPKESSEAGVSRAWEFSILAWRTPFT